MRGRKAKEGRKNILLSLDVETVATADRLASETNLTRSELVKLAITTLAKDESKLVELARKIEQIRAIVAE